jgi:hypothetical protein
MQIVRAPLDRRHAEVVARVRGTTIANKWRPIMAHPRSIPVNSFTLLCFLAAVNPRLARTNGRTGTPETVAAASYAANGSCITDKHGEDAAQG